MNASPAAPELDVHLEWINAPAVSFRRHRGRVVVLGFWHAGSAWCRNLLDDLRHIQARHADGVSVFGIHTPKFDAERDPRRVLKAINRCDVRFPVANDTGFIAWQHFGVRAWPSIVVLDTQGQVVEVRSGDLQRDALDALVARLLDDAGERDLRSYESTHAVLRPEPRLPLRFPAGLAVTPNHLYVADTGHHRVLECSHDGRILRQFGSANPGLLDGGSAECSFTAPQGLAVLKDMLYVCDTGNHALRRIRLLDGDVDTFAGTGRAGIPVSQT